MFDVLTRLLSTTLIMATPMLVAAMGTLFIERSGIINIGNEGFMIMGALMGVVGSYVSGSAFVGALVAMLSAGALGLVFAFFTITLRANQNVTGLALTTFGVGIGNFFGGSLTGLAVNAIAAAVTSLLFRQIFGLSASVPRIETFETLPIPLLRDIPVLGVLFEQTAVGYLAFLLVPLTTFVLRRTRLGLTVRSVGENPLCCDTLGIHVQRTRYLSVLYGSMMAGLGGAFVSMGQLSFFTVGMIAGRGYMTLAAIVFGNYTPWGIMLACVLFGAVSSLQYMLQATSSLIPYQLWVSFPYLFAVLALCLYRTRSKAPACSGQPFVRK